MLGAGTSHAGAADVAFVSNTLPLSPLPACVCYTRDLMATHRGALASVRATLATDSGMRALRLLRWLLPLSLATIAFVFEMIEHVREGLTTLEAGFVAEVLLFALVGPIAIFLTLRWVEGLLLAYQETSDELASVNRDLESRIAERTAHLAETSAQLRGANAELAVANEELRKLDDLKSEFVSLVSHQLRAPLTNINGALEIVSQEAEHLPEETQRTLRILVHETERLSWLIRTILDVSRIEAGRLNPRLGPVAVGPLLAQACASTVGVDPDRSYGLQVEEGLPPAWADETLLGEVVRNLIDNALSYSPEGAPIEVTAELAGDRIAIAVTDHGEGVPASEQGRVFTSFYRVVDGSDSVRGTGLGLYFAERLVRAQGGRLAVESPIWTAPEPPGSRFTFTVPLADDAPDEFGAAGTPGAEAVEATA
jgi:signal transduction histidine kinase